MIVSLWRINATRTIILRERNVKDIGGAELIGFTNLVITDADGNEQRPEDDPDTRRDARTVESESTPPVIAIAQEDIRAGDEIIIDPATGKAARRTP